MGDIPKNIGELSRYELEHAIDTVEQGLRLCPVARREQRQEWADAVSIIRLVTGMPRRSPWYGTTLPSMYGHYTVDLGTLLASLANDLEYVGGASGVILPRAQSLALNTANRLRALLRKGKQEFDDYLLHLTDPQRWEQEQEERRLREEEVAHMRRMTGNYLWGNSG